MLDSIGKDLNELVLRRDVVREVPCASRRDRQDLHEVGSPATLGAGECTGGFEGEGCTHGETPIGFDND